MIRVLLFFISLATFISVGLWLSGQPGAFVLTWGDYELHTNLGIFFSFLLLTVIIFSNIWLFIRWIWHLPSILKNAQKAKNYKKSFEYFIQYLENYITLNNAKSLKNIKNIRKKVKDPGLSFLMEGEISKKNNDFEKGILCGQQALLSPVTNFLGYWEIITCYFHLRKYDKALDFLEDAKKKHKKNPWILKNLGVLYMKNSKWDLASQNLSSIEETTKEIKTEKNQLLAILYYMEGLKSKKNKSHTLFEKAVSLDPSFSPAAILYVQNSKSQNKVCDRKILEQCWSLNPTLEVGFSYVQTYPINQSIERFKAAQYLHSKNFLSPEGYILLIQTAINSQLWGEARSAMEEGVSKSILNQHSTYIKLLEDCLEKAPNHDKSTSFFLEKNFWSCNDCNSIQKDWFFQCPSCNGIRTAKLSHTL